MGLMSEAIFHVRGRSMIPSPPDGPRIVGARIDGVSGSGVSRIVGAPRMVSPQTAGFPGSGVSRIVRPRVHTGSAGFPPGATGMPPYGLAVMPPRRFAMSGEIGGG